MLDNCRICETNVRPTAPVAVENTRYQLAQPARITHVVFNDQSTFKGVLWGLGAFKLGGTAIGCAYGTLLTSPFLVLPPFTVIPVAAGIATYCFASLTDTCIKNACYHLGHRQVVVLN